MDTFSIEITKDADVLNFQVVDYPHHEEDNRCKFDVLKDGKLVASFEPDSKGYLHICKNMGAVDEEILHLIADKLEVMGI
jgi:hypothetical protein